MKQTIEMQKIQDRMRPGALTKDGFLGTDTRNLVDIITEDDAAVRRMEYTHEAIARRMKEIRDKGKKGIGNAVSAEKRFEVCVESIRGKLPSPFNDQVLVRKTNTVVKNLHSGKEIMYTDLNILLIEKHGFYEGKGSPFRLEPGDLIEILEVRKTT
ncbi:hypothetical protein ACFL6D_00995 [Spirochaetota bacterium]